MSRRRRVNTGLPKYVWKDGRGFRWKKYLGKGKFGPTVTIAPVTASVREVWAAWERLQESDGHGTLRWLLDKYLESPQAAKRKRMDEQRRLADVMCRHLAGKKTLGDRQCSELERKHIRRYLDVRAEDGAPVSGNREKALLSTAWNWALERGHVEHPNPCDGVRNNQEKARDRYVTDEEFEQALQHATPDYLRIALELAFLLRARRGEVLGLLWGDVRPDGVLVRRTKGSDATVVRWSDRLRRVIEEARQLPGEASVLVIHDRHGQPISETAYNSARRRMMKRAGLSGFTGHDLKAKGTSDLQNATPHDTGHRSPSQFRKYVRKPGVTDASG